MASLFSGPPKPKAAKIEPVKTADASLAQAAINRQRQQAVGTYRHNVQGSRGIALDGMYGQKTSLGQ